MKAEIIRPKELDATLISLWRSFQESSTSLASPFFAPEFAVAVGSAREDARVAIISDGSQVKAFFPFHHSLGGVAKPIGGDVCDYQGVINAPDFHFRATDFLKACELKAYDFNHAPMQQTALTEGAYRFSSSPQIDLAEGYETYVADQPKSFRKRMAEVRRQTRKIESEIGPLRFVYHEPSSAAYQMHVIMRNRLYQRLNVKTLLGTGSWLDATLEALSAVDNPTFGGLFSALYAGDRLIAAQFGLRSRSIWHWWFTSYDTDVYKYGPGILLIVSAAQNARNNGLSVIDFGRGESHYKLTFANTSVSLCEGSIEIPNSVPGVARRAQRLNADTLKRLPIGRYEDLLRRAGNRLLTGGVRLD